MPLILLCFGALFLASAINGSSSALTTQLKKDFTGRGSFLYWLAAIGILGAIGYVPGGQRFSRAFLGLLLLSMFLANSGVFVQLQNAIAQAGASSNAPTQGT